MQKVEKREGKHFPTTALSDRFNGYDLSPILNKKGTPYFFYKDKKIKFKSITLYKIVY